jgi:5-methylcytosine-specific restriction endonuclease McrA
MNLNKSSVLVLNSAYEPLRFASAKRAITLLYKGVATAEESYEHIKIHTQTVWDENTGEYITEDTFLPAVIRLINYKYIQVRSQMLTRKNILIRDGYTCAYCNKKLSYDALTLDHIVPKVKGGLSTWENLVACCSSCNHKKGDRELSEISDMTLSHYPKQSTSHTIRHILRNRAYDNPIWQKYLFF